ncbi:SusC/RagA family TonB-linked outer membrane protein [Echinicola strongylocentroti]|uniref:SusC/RagA family TonB-linked outer membrane protein n=1 Tax=Echinicola strongylocentroti TaxID=1795355 RepID=A0A2Z4ILY8_9BACT|nr:SusC/RagA family TonB-linked outer membrane protein [Echinicola strongylocentroti]AWW32131.1 SusC/RagA family TonB-linked outer membrane protein [Echinicola strongylocentroti]
MQIYLPNQLKIGLAGGIASCLLVLLIIPLQATTYLDKWGYPRQTVSIDVSEKSLLEIFDTIESKSDYVFAFDNKNHDFRAVRLTLKFDQALIDDVLRSIEQKTAFEFNRINKVISVRKKRVDQPYLERDLKGLVKDALGETLPGVNVMVKGTTMGTVTDIDGEFSISIPDEEEIILVFTFVGFGSQEIAVSDQSFLEVVMEDDVQGLNEIVVTAAGIERNSNTLGYSVSTLNSDEVSQRNEPDPIRSLTGKIAGVNIQGGGGVAGGTTNITIRGNSSLGNNNQPLFVVDGVPFDNSSFGPVDGENQTQSAQSTTNRSFDIDPNNIASMTVLKGAAAAALYGSRAANGAIIITTKTGSTGRKGFEITFNSSYSQERISGLPEYQRVFGQGTSWDYRPGVYGSYGSPYSSRETIPHPLSPSYTSEDFPEFYQADGVTPLEVPYQSYAGESQKDFFRVGNLLENAISINTGNEKGGLMIGVSRMDNKGIVPGNEVSRTSFNVGGNADLENGFYVRGTISYVKTNQQSPPIGGRSSVMENLLYLANSYDLTNLPYEHPLTGDNVFYRAIDNPYWSVENSLSTSEVNRYYGNISLGNQITPWLDVKNTFGFNGYTDERTSVLGQGSSRYAPGAINTDHIFRQELDNTLLVTAELNPTENWSFRAILGNNINQRLTRRTAFQGDQIIVRGIDDIRNTTTITLADIPNNQALVKQRYYAFFADLTFDYKTFASINFVGRNDVSSTLPAENRSYLYGGVNGSFEFTEAFNLNGRTVNFGSLRIGYTKVGNEARPYQTINVFNANREFGGLGSPFSNANNSNVSTQTMSDLMTNSELQPEFITEFEVGSEIRLWQSLVTLDVTYYNKKSTSQIFVVNAAPSSGYLTRIINLGETSNKGVEIGLSASPLMSDNGLNWNINANFTRNRNKVEDIGDFAQLTYGGNVHIAGMPYGMIYGTGYARDQDGEILVNPQTAKPIASASSIPIGDPNPDFMLGFSNSLSWRGINFNFLFDWKQGGDILSTTIGQMYARGMIKDSEDRPHMIHQGVMGDVNTRTPLLDENGNTIPNNTAISYNEYFFSSGFGPGGLDAANVFDATVIRLREVSLGYEFPKSLLASTPFGSVNISLSGRNLWYLAPNTPEAMNYDPELSTSSSNNMGYDQLGVPPTKRYGVNLSVSF